MAKGQKAKFNQQQGLQGAFAYLRQFRFDLFCKKSKDIQDVDALSRVEAGAAVCAEDVTEGWAVDVEIETDFPTPAGAACKVPTDEDGPGVAQVEMEGVWGFDTLLKSVDELQQSDDEVRLIRHIRSGADEKLLEVVPRARASVNEYKSRDPQLQNFVEGADGRLYHLSVQGNSTVRQLFIPLELRESLVVQYHGSATGGHRAADETLAKLKKKFFWPAMNREVKEWIASCGCQRKKGERKQQHGEMQSMKVMRPGEKMIFDFFWTATGDSQRE